MSHSTFTPTDLDRALLNMPASGGSREIELAACEPEPELAFVQQPDNLAARQASGFATITSRAVSGLPLGLLATLALWFWQGLSEF